MTEHEASPRKPPTPRSTPPAGCCGCPPFSASSPRSPSKPIANNSPISVSSLSCSWAYARTATGAAPTAGPRRRVPPREMARRLRLLRLPLHQPRRPQHSRGLQLVRRAAALPDRRLRHRQSPAHRPGHRLIYRRVPFPYTLASKLVNYLSEASYDNSSPRLSPSTVSSTCSASTSSSTYYSIVSSPICFSSSLLNGKRQPSSLSLPTSLFLAVLRLSSTLFSAPLSSIFSPSTPSSSIPSSSPIFSLSPFPSSFRSPPTLQSCPFLSFTLPSLSPIF